MNILFLFKLKWPKNKSLYDKFVYNSTTDHLKLSRGAPVTRRATKQDPISVRMDTPKHSKTLRDTLFRQRITAGSGTDPLVIRSKKWLAFINCCGYTIIILGQ